MGSCLSTKVKETKTITSPKGTKTEQKVQLTKVGFQVSFKVGESMQVSKKMK